MHINLHDVVYLETTEGYVNNRNFKPYNRFTGKLSLDNVQDMRAIYGEDKLYWLIGKIIFNQSNHIQDNGGDQYELSESQIQEYGKLVGNLYEQLDNIEITFKE